MKIRESGMPEEKEWNEYFNPTEALKLLSVNESTLDVADFGCGYGTFTIPAARIIKGKVYAFDIEPEMINVVEQKAKKYNLTNVKPILRDFMVEGSGLEDSSVDFVMLFNILHLCNPLDLLKEAYRILKHSGRLGIIHWNYDSSTPRGPPMDIRPRPEQIILWAKSVGFSLKQRLDLKPYHYALLMSKVKNELVL
ncbi:MAG: class I SAM-dependent methyltransferase [Candidatus Hodarchaeota archaeon]